MIEQTMRTEAFSYPPFGENPDGDHDIDLTHGSVLRDKQIGIKHGISRSAKLTISNYKIVKINWKPLSEKKNQLQHGGPASEEF
jgi:RNA-binding protein YlmH